MRLIALFGMVLAAGPGLATSADRWNVQFFHDEDKSSVIITDLVFPTRSRGFATAALINDGGRKPVLLVTSDGGTRWTTLKAPDYGHSLFCLDETACWMAGQRGVWFSTETGRDWRRVLSEPDIRRVYFLNAERGFAIGARKSLFETRDGGKHWTKMKVALEVKSNADRTTFSAICFFGKNGLIAGRSEPPDRSRVPLWMDDKIEQRKERPSLSIVLETRDGGETWTVNTASLFGRISHLQSAPDGRALALVEFDRWFSFASEVYHLDLSKGKNQRSLRSADVAVTDILISSSGQAYAAGFEPPGKLARLPVPGKLRVMRSEDLSGWKEMEVDYRAVARRVMLASAGPGDVWLATDTGMILKLEGERPGQ